MKKLISIFVSMLMMISTLFAEEQNMSKHPRVIEVEMMISKEATTFLQQRLPNSPVYVNVDIEPLRRNVGTKNEQLPYFYSEDEVGDEWDALDTPIVLLLARIKKANIKVEVPSTVNELEVADLKEKLYQQLKLIPGRDTINIERKVPATKPVVVEAKDYSLYYFVAGMAVLIFAGLFVLLRFGSKPAVASSQSATSANAMSSASAPIPIRPTAKANFGASGTGQINSKVNGDIAFKDSMRASDMLKEKLQGVVNSPVFPLLSDMIILEDLADKSLSSFGAFVFELQLQHQQKVFFRGRSDKWFKGYIEAASVDMDCFVAVEKMIRNRATTGSDKWEELLIQVWRLNDEAHLFLKQIPLDEAFAILAHLPKSFSVPMAKKAFPGGWARILESRDNTSMKDQKKIEDYLERALQLRPYFSFKSIDEYRKDLELIDYLRLASVKDEEEIYESLNSNSHIHSLRPPFYAVFKAAPEDFKIVFEQFDMSSWAIATLNTNRDYHKKITALLDDKKKYLFTNMLTQFDESLPDIKEQIALKEEIGKRYYQLLRQQKAMAGQTKTESKEIETDEKYPRAA